MQRVDSKKKKAKYRYLERIPKTLIYEILKSRVIPVVGAGLSINAENIPKDKYMPSWDQLGKMFCSLLDIECDKIDATKCISDYEKSTNRTHLLTYLKEFLLIDIIRPGRAHRNFIKIPFKTIVTTNFDNLIEQSFELNRTASLRIVHSQDFPLEKAGQTNIVKIHGDFSKPGSIIITEDDYRNIVKKSTLYKNHIPHLFIGNTLLFIGYSYRDPDLQKIIKAINNDLEPLTVSMYALLINEDEEKINIFKNYKINPIVIDDGSKSKKTILVELFDALADHVENEIRRQKFDNIDLELSKRIEDIRNIEKSISTEGFGFLRKLILKIILEVFSQSDSVIRIAFENRELIQKASPLNYISFEQEIQLYDIIAYSLQNQKLKIESLSSYKKLQSKINKIHIIKNQLNKNYYYFGLSQLLSLWNIVLHILLVTMISILRNRDLDLEELFENLFVDLERFFSIKKLPIAHISPLYNFYLNGLERFQLDKQTAIRKISHTEKIGLRGVSNLGVDDLKDFDSVQYILEYKSKINKKNTVNQYYPQNVIEIILSIIIAMRLFQMGSVALYSISRRISLNIPFIQANLNLNVLNLSSSFGFSYELKNSDIPRFKRFWYDYSKLLLDIMNLKRNNLDELRPISRALQLFNYAYSKRHGNDSFMDLVRTIITLLTPRDESFPKNKSRIIKRCVTILNSSDMSAKNKRELFHIFNQYESLIRGKEIKDFDLMRLEDITRRVLLHYLKELKSIGYSHEMITNNLEKPSQSLLAIKVDE